jgi:ATP-dependent helicase/nuclease subunit A
LGETKLSATQIGDATHKALEHLDYTRACDERDIRAQIGELAARGLLSVAQAAVVDTSAIAWLAATTLGAMLRANAKQLRREVAFAAAIEDGGTKMDAVMVRGRIDLLLPMDGGVALVDYKTDRVTDDGIKDRAESYLNQMKVYRDALHRVAGKEVVAVYLVFLHPRVVWQAD